MYDGYKVGAALAIFLSSLPTGTRSRLTKASMRVPAARI
jgi:hypothetical protein